MSSVALLALSLLYLLPLALLALLLTADWRRPRWVTTAVLGALPLFYISHYQALQAVQGWPSDATVPAEFRLLAFDIKEPDARQGHDGEILLWVRDTAGGQARAHRLAYRKELHEALVTAGRQQAEGSPQLGVRTPAPDAATTGSREGAQDTINFRKDQAALPAKESAD